MTDDFTVLHVLHCSPPAYRIGGPSISVPSLINSLFANYRLRQTLVSSNLDVDQVMDVPCCIPVCFKDYVCFYLPVVFFPSSFPLSTLLNALIKRSYFSFRSFAFLFYLVREHDVIHLHLPFISNSLLAALFCVVLRKPYIVSYRGCFDSARLRQGYIYKLIYIYIFEKLIARLAFSCHALSNNEKLTLRKWLSPRSVTVLPNCADLKDNLPTNLDNSRDFNSCIKVLFISRFEPIKCPHVIVHAIRHLLDNYPALGGRFKFLFAGPMDEKFSAYNESFFQSIQGYSSISYLGPVFGRQKYKLLSSVNFVVLPSQSEGLPMALVESLGMGTPIIASQQCNIDKIDLYNSGFLLNDDCSNLSSILSSISNLDLSQYMGLVFGAKSHFDHEFSPSSVSNGYMKLYASAFSHVSSLL